MLGVEKCGWSGRHWAAKLSKNQTKMTGKKDWMILLRSHHIKGPIRVLLPTLAKFPLSTNAQRQGKRYLLRIEALPSTFDSKN